jgi:hypothetical protein
MAGEEGAAGLRRKLRKMRAMATGAGCWGGSDLAWTLSAFRLHAMASRCIVHAACVLWIEHKDTVSNTFAGRWEGWCCSGFAS